MTNAPHSSGDVPGLVIVGSEPDCGKTVLMCGIAGALREQGFETQVMKPLILSSRKRAESELAFMAAVGQKPINLPISFIEGPASLDESSWHQAINYSRNPVNQLTLVEMPGGAATPVCYDETNIGKLSHNWRDSADLATEFSRPCLVVAKHQEDAIERLVITCKYLQARGLNVIAQATVETSGGAGTELEAKRTRADFSMGLYGRSMVPFLGCIKFSPSISVPRVSQGNLIKMTAGLDLLLLLKALNIGVPAIDRT
jgi:dethiobiotin synthetase